MIRLIPAVVLSIGLSLGAVLRAPRAQAAFADAGGPPMTASGIAQPTSETVTSVQSADGNVIVGYVASGTISGTFTGAYTEVGEAIGHPGGTQNFHSLITFTGTAADCGTGTVRFQVDGMGAGPLLHGTITTVDQSDDTAVIHAQLSFVEVGGPLAPLAYSGTDECI